MFTLEIHCQDPWFSYLEQGIKPVEGRKGQEKYTSLLPGDQIRFHFEERAFTAKVVRVDRFTSVAEYLNGVGLDKALPGVQTIEEGIAIYSQWSTPEEIARFGFVGIWIER